MKNILGLIMGSIAGWIICGYFTDDFSVERFFMFLMGIIIGYIIGRNKPKGKKVDLGT
ncbi:tRNA U-34 5-methylaminomethyl-2-thiouridine biosynthesis protein [Solibacillus silvestris]